MSATQKIEGLVFGRFDKCSSWYTLERYIEIGAGPAGFGTTAIPAMEPLGPNELRFVTRAKELHQAALDRGEPVDPNYVDPRFVHEAARQLGLRPRPIPT